MMKGQKVDSFLSQELTGEKFIELVFSVDNEKEERTTSLISKGPTYASVGVLLQMLYKLSVCGYGCRKGDHKIEYLTGRAYNTSIASLKLLRIGFYDESLSLIRSVAEIINLLALFRIDTEEYDSWVSSSEKKRIRGFAPASVRKKLEKKTDLEIPISKEYYSKLCEVGVHVNPKTRPAGYNIHDRAMVGGFVLDHAPIAILNDLQYVVFFSVLISSSCTLEKEKFIEVTEILKEHTLKFDELSIMNLGVCRTFRL